MAGTGNTSNPIPKPEELGYVDFPSLSASMAGAPETFKQKAIRKTKENPFVPLGLGVTVFALTYGLWQMKTGDRAMSQKMMRLRVFAQSFTVVALLGGVGYNGYKMREKRRLEAEMVK